MATLGQRQNAKVSQVGENTKTKKKITTERQSQTERQRQRERERGKEKRERERERDVLKTLSYLIINSFPPSEDAVRCHFDKVFSIQASLFLSIQ